GEILAGRAQTQLPQTLHLPGPLGGAMTIRCRGQRRGPEFALYKAGARNAAAQGGDLAGVKFPIPKVSQADGGSYTCFRRMRFVSPPLTACLFVTPEGSYPKPSISISPSGVIPMGGNFTIWCWHQLLDMSIQLYKAGDGNYLTYTDPAGSEAEFPITSARRDHGGSYTCRYSNRTDPPAYSEPSDPVQIIVAEPSYPKPNISLRPSGRVAPGAAVTVRCECQCRGARVLLSKAGDSDARRVIDLSGDVAEFPIRSVSQRDAGSYSCQYSTKSNPSVWSEPSNPVELIVAGEEPGSMYPLPAPHPAGLSGGLALVGRSEPGSGVITVGVSSLPRQTLVLFPQGELTQPSQERPQFPPDQALWVQVLGLGGITIGPALKTGLRCLGAGAGMGTVNLVGGAQTSQGGAH
uniref:Ig-like domain-containing protein n=1 Tax=Chelonoidis abingdonii TaxID=106734 RepID=A0A8C0H8R4_CHEAB